MDTPRIFIASAPGNEQAELALTNSIAANASGPTDIKFMRSGDIGWDDWYDGMVTPFTLFRWAIPELCNYQGYAIYLDVDMIVLGDINELWNYRQAGKWLCAGREDVSVIDCSAYRTILPSIERLKKMERLDKFAIRSLVNPSAEIPECWNHCDKLEHDTKLLHFTNVETQPWKPWPQKIAYRRHPRPDCVELWKRYAGLL